MSIRSYGERRDEQMEIQFDSISEPKWKGREREREGERNNCGRGSNSRVTLSTLDDHDPRFR